VLPKVEHARELSERRRSWVSFREVHDVDDPERPGRGQELGGDLGTLHATLEHGSTPAS
jgi:hypothetical protein